MKYKGIIFDLDGTLVDTAEDLAAAMNYALASFGQPVFSVHECKMMVGSGVNTFAQRALKKESQHLQYQIIDLMKEQYKQVCFDKSRVYDGIVDVLGELVGMGLKLAVVTNKVQEEAERVIKHFFAENVFVCVAGVTEQNTVKPNPAGTLRCADMMNLGCDDILFIGDSEIDIETAKAAGMRFVGVSWGFRGTRLLRMAGAQTVIDRPVEILDLVA